MIQKVCPECGCSNFLSEQHITRSVVIDGNGRVIEHGEDMLSANLSAAISCISCKKSLTVDDLVTEPYFYEVIVANEDPEKPSSQSLTKEQLRLMWLSDFTFMEGKDQQMHVIKDKYRQFGKVSNEGVNNLLRSTSKVLVVHMNKTHITNFSVFSGGSRNVHK